MKSVKLANGNRGWRGRLQENYRNFDEFFLYSSQYNLTKRLGFKRARHAWDANPFIQGSTNPKDFKIVKPTPQERRKVWAKVEADCQKLANKKLSFKEFKKIIDRVHENVVLLDQ